MKSINEPIEDIRLIRKMMEESSRFLSLSGLSGISVGLIAIAGAAVVHFGLLREVDISIGGYPYAVNSAFLKVKWSIALVATCTLFCAIFAAWYFTWRKGLKKNGSFWTPSAKKMVFSLGSVLVVGGLLSLILFMNGTVKMVPGTMLTFYGLALLNASKYSHRDIVYLAWLQVTMGLAASLFPSIGLLLWVFGFGLLHVVYGSIMYIKYDR